MAASLSKRTLLSAGALVAAVSLAAAATAASAAAKVSDKPDTPFKLATFDAGGKSRVGLYLNGRLLDLGQANLYVQRQAGLAPMAVPTEMRALIEAYPRVAPRLYQIANYLKSRNVAALPFAYTEEKAEIDAPVKYPWNLLNMAFNYWGHAKEMSSRAGPGRQIDIDPDRDAPFIFAKSPRSTIIASGAPFYIPEGRKEIDYEGEIVTVIGPKATRVPKEKAQDYIFGYTIINDISDREDLYRKQPTFRTDWFSQKSRDGAAPIGPYITPKEFMPPAHKIHMTTRVNGVVKQDGDTSDQIYDVEHQIAFITSIQTLFPGDMIAAGSQAGVGVARHPPEFLKPGDVVEIEIENVGTLRTPFVAAPIAAGL